MKKNMMNKIILAAATAPLMPLGLHAADLFQINAISPGQSVTVGGSNLIDLVNNAIDSKDQFAKFQNKQTTLSLNYAGVKDAIVFTVNAANTQATLKLPSSSLQTFTGTSRDDLQTQIEDFLKKEGSAQYSELLKELANKTPVAVTDGNPNSATAKVALSLFRNYGAMTAPASSSIERSNPSDYELVGDIGAFSAGDYKGNTYFVPITMDIRLSDNIRLGIDIPLSYSTVDSAKVFDAGLTLSLPVRIINSSAEASTPSVDAQTGRTVNVLPTENPQPWTWQITPTAGAVAAGSVEFLAGGVIGYGSLTNMVAYNFPSCTVSMGNQISFFKGQSISFGDYTLDSGTSQQLLKNGLQVSIPIGERYLVDVYGNYSNYLQDAAVSNWFTVGIDAGVRLFGSSSTMLKVGYYSDLGKDYTSYVGRVGFGWRF